MHDLQKVNVIIKHVINDNGFASVKQSNGGKIVVVAKSSGNANDSHNSVHFIVDTISTPHSSL